MTAISTVTLAPASTDDIIALRHGATHIGAWSTPADDLEPPGVLDVLTKLYGELETNPGWGSWFIVKDGMIVGNCSLTEAPTDDSCMIGYSIHLGSRGRGYATAAVAELTILLRNRGFATVRAETSAPNMASHVVLIRSGFHRIGERTDPEDGDIVTWQRAL